MPVSSLRPSVMTPEGRKHLIEVTMRMLSKKRHPHPAPTGGGTKASHSAAPVKELPRAA